MSDIVDVVVEAIRGMGVDDLRIVGDAVRQQWKDAQREEAGNFRVGQSVHFFKGGRGRNAGLHYGTVTSIGRSGKVAFTSQHGVRWTCAPSLITAGKPEGVTTVPARKKSGTANLSKAMRSSFAALACQLSPENLYADGERTHSAAMRLKTDIMAEWAALEREVGRSVSESEVW